MTATAKKISLDFRRVKDVAGMAAATLRSAEPYRPHAPWQMPETIDALKHEISRAQAFMNDRAYKMRMAEISEAAEKMDHDVEAMDKEIEELKKKFNFGILTGRGRAITNREQELHNLEAEHKKLQMEERMMRAGYDEAKGRLEKMNDRLDTLAGRPPKPKKFDGFKL